MKRGGVSIPEITIKISLEPTVGASQVLSTSGIGGPSPADVMSGSTIVQESMPPVPSAIIGAASIESFIGPQPLEMAALTELETAANPCPTVEPQALEAVQTPPPAMVQMAASTELPVPDITPEQPESTPITP